jgi:enoyl-CoA hydratase/3-hydroxyacyl-CoA dehydrogenase
MLDRIFDNWVNESGYCLPFATAKQVDKVAEEFAAAGPFWVVDMSNGNPIIVETNTRQMEAEGECYRPAHIFNSVLRWVVGKRGEEVEISPEIRARVRDRLLGILFSQSLDIAARAIGTPEELELGCLQALGFKRGPFELMEKLGKEEVEGVLTRFEAERPGFPGRSYLSRFSELTSFPRFIQVDRLADVLVITLRRPAQLNALTDQVTDEILSVLKEYEEDPGVLGFVLCGYGTRAFCAGADIGKFPQMLGDAEASAEYARDSSRLLEYLDTMTKPVVAAVNGLALGGGAELALRCHDRVASTRALFSFPEVTLGILPGIGGLIIPYRKWPAAAATFTRMLVTNERLSAKAALELGVVSSLEDEYEELIQKAAERVRALSGTLPLALPALALGDADIPTLEATAADGTPLSQEVVGIILTAVREGIAAPDLASALEVGYRAFGRVAATQAAAEGIGAFLAGRKPDYTGM